MSTLGFNNNKRNDNINEAKQSLPKRNFDTAVKQHEQNKDKVNKKHKDLTPITTMKVNKDGLMALSALQTLYYLNTRTETFNKVMKDVVHYYIKDKKINKSDFQFLYKMYMRK